MNNFEFCSFSHFVFGRGAETKAGTVLANDGAHTVLILHDSGQFLYDSGLLDAVKKNLEDAGLRWVELGGVKPNPVVSGAREGIILCKQENVDYVLSIGGGSAIDTGKAICAGLAYEGDVWDLFTTGAKADSDLKVKQAVILTYPATGSESAFSTILGDDETKQKKGMRGGGNFMRPNHVFMNPELSMTLPVKMTLCGIVDMYSHIVERYFSNTNVGLIDYMSEGAMRAIRHFGYILKNDPQNYEARSEIMYAGSVAHNDTLGVGRRKDMASHDMGAEIGALYNTIHGVTISVIMPHWMRYVYKSGVERFARYAVEVFGIEPDPDNLEKTALAGVDATQKYFEDMLMPTSFSAAGIPTDNLERIAGNTIAGHGGKPIGNFKALEYDDVLAILKAAAGGE